MEKIIIKIINILLQGNIDITEITGESIILGNSVEINNSILNIIQNIEEITNKKYTYTLCIEPNNNAIYIREEDDLPF